MPGILVARSNSFGDCRKKIHEQVHAKKFQPIKWEKRYISTLSLLKVETVIGKYVKIGTLPNFSKG